MQRPHPATAPAAHRSRRGRVAVLLPSLALVAVLGACGQDDGTGGASASPTTVGPTTGPTGPTEAPSPSAQTQAPAQPTSTSTATSAPADLSAELSVAYDDGAGTAQTYDLVCDGTQASGTAPDPAGACDALAGAGADALQPFSGDVQCTQVFGGPQSATVSGTVGGDPVSADLARADGCEIDRWDALVPLVPAADS